MRTWIVLAGLLFAACRPVAEPTPAAVEFVNASKPTRCAEEDNVYVKVIGENIGRFRIRAEHPPYIADVAKDSTAPDFSHCDMSSDPRYDFEPRKVVLYEDASMRLVGHRFGSFWRPSVVDVRVGDVHESGLHLIQLVRRIASGEVEQLVVYPADGYWRLKPLPPHRLPDSAYGSSFLFGPIEEAGRPFVAVREIVIEPHPLRFRLAFADGRTGTLAIVETSAKASTLEVSIDPPLATGRPFAALRSMWVSDRQADVALVAWRTERGGQATSAAVLDFTRTHAAAMRFGRVVPSQHNLSAPDMVFERFERAATR